MIRNINVFVIELHVCFNSADSGNPFRNQIDRSIDQCTDAPHFVCLRHRLLDLSTCGKPLVQLGTSQAALLCKSDLQENCTCPDFGAMSIEHESHF